LVFKEQKQIEKQEPVADMKDDNRQ
jgi:hypothetical protein